MEKQKDPKYECRYYNASRQVSSEFKKITKQPFEDAGCFNCDGYNSKCNFYYSSQLNLKKWREENE